jgi:hypothetical protein
VLLLYNYRSYNCEIFDDLLFIYSSISELPGALLLFSAPPGSTPMAAHRPYTHETVTGGSEVEEALFFELHLSSTAVVPREVTGGLQSCPELRRRGIISIIHRRLRIYS